MTSFTLTPFNPRARSNRTAVWVISSRFSSVCFLETLGMEVSSLEEIDECHHIFKYFGCHERLPPPQALLHVALCAFSACARKRFRRTHRGRRWTGAER